MVIYDDMEGNSDVSVMFIDQTKTPHQRWVYWKPYEKCTPEEKEKFNLRQIYITEALLDFENMDIYKEKIDKLKRMGFKFYAFKSGSRGFHVHIFFKGFEMYEEELRNEARKLLIREFGADESKASESTMIAMPGRPHFKTMQMKELIEAVEGINESFPGHLIIQAQKNIEKNKETLAKLPEIDFKDWHLTDPIFLYAKENGLADGTERDTVIFPNWAVALAKEGLSRDEVEAIIKPVLKLMPGKHYAEFEGWYDKAYNHQISDFNPIQLNKWIDKYNFPIQKYDLEPLELDLFTTPPTSQLSPELQRLQDANPEIKVIQAEQMMQQQDKWKLWKNGELLNRPKQDTDWLVEGWIAKGDTCFIAGRASSYKSTLLLHMGVAIANGKPFLNKYPTKEQKVLYLNEENNLNLMQSMYARIVSGLDLEAKDIKNFSMTIMENIRLDTPKTKPNVKTDLEILADILKREDKKVLILDSFKRFTTFDENDANKTNDFFHKINKLKSLMGEDFTVIILHHLKKETAGHTMDPRDMMRGSSDIINASDNVIFIDRKVGKNVFVMQHIKLRADAEKAPRLIIVEDNGKGGTYMRESDKAITNSTKTLTKANKCALEIIRAIENGLLPGKDPQNNIFSKSEILNVGKIISIYNGSDITRALTELKDDGTVTLITGGKKGMYKVNNPEAFKERIKSYENPPSDEYDPGEHITDESGELTDDIV